MNTLNNQNIDFIKWIDYIVNYERAEEIREIPFYNTNFMSQ